MQAGPVVEQPIEPIGLQSHHGPARAKAVGFGQLQVRPNRSIDGGPNNSLTGPACILRAQLAPDPTKTILFDARDQHDVQMRDLRAR
jgi:hypothetical protein